jgi:hypothetical protein
MLGMGEHNYIKRPPIFTEYMPDLQRFLAMDEGQSKVDNCWVNISN